MVIEKSVIPAILSEFNHQDEKTLEQFRVIVEKHIALDDLIQSEDVSAFHRLSFKLYSPKDKGRIGKHKESIKRISRMIDNGESLIAWYEFFAHSAKECDFIDSFEETEEEYKSGIGDWIYSEQPDFSIAIEEYKSGMHGNIIEWEYDKYNIRMRYSFSKFFEILEAYNPKKGLLTWFTPATGKRSKGNMRKRYVWKMQSLENSGKKVAYLRQFNNF